MVDFFALIGQVSIKINEILDVMSVAMDEKDTAEANKLLMEAKKWSVVKQDLIKATKEKFGEKLLSPATKEMLKGLLPEKPVTNMKHEMELMGLPEKSQRKEELDTMFETIPSLKRPVSWAPPKHSDDIDAGPIDLTSAINVESLVKQADGEGKEFKLLLSFARALAHIFQHAHWASANTNFYGDHLLFERIYNSANGDIDVIAEKAVGITNDSSTINPIEDIKYTAIIVNKLVSGEFNPESFSEIGIAAEKEFLKLIEKMMAGNKSDGVQNMLQGIADKHEGHLYLLQQRNRTASLLVSTLTKFAFNMDRASRYSEADKIDAMIKDLCERTGLKISGDDLVATSNKLDELGLYEEADQIDGMVKEAKCPQCGNHEFGLGDTNDMCEDCGYPMVRLPREPGVKKMLTPGKRKHKDDDTFDKT